MNTLPSAPHSAFGADYAGARSRFQRAATAAGATLASYEYPEVGPDGASLYTDTAWLGPAQASRVLVTVSGTHGVEGFCGSGAQVDWLRRGEGARLPKDTAALLVHAINPYGFAWLRRVTHDNIDLNRNWISFKAPVPASPAYDELHELLCPSEWTEPSRAASLNRIRTLIERDGMAAFAQAVSGGQYRHADGLFFGGTGPCWSRQTLSSILGQRLGAARRVGIIDYHSGLGPQGLGEKIASAAEGTPELARARAWHGLDVVTVGGAGSSSAQLTGEWAAAMPALLPHAEVTTIALEFGTVDLFQVLDALRADLWLHTHADPQGPAAAAIKAQIRGAFYIDDDLWRGMILGQSVVACRQVTKGLQT